MAEYTSLDISKRLAEAGFKAETDMQHQDVTIGDKIKGLPHVREFTLNGTPAYRADTLLVWLLERGRIEEIFENVENKTVVSFDDLRYLTGINGGVAQNLSDALGEVVLKLLAKEAKHD